MDTEKEPEKNDNVAAEAGEGLRRENEALLHDLKSRDAVIVKLEQAMAAKESEMAALKNELEGLRQAVAARDEAVARAVAAYQEMAVAANPGLPPELIAGATIDVINASVKNARAVVEKVRQEMETEAARTRVPAGAPLRSAPDFSGLSPREKIQQGLK